MGLGRLQGSRSKTDGTPEEAREISSRDVVMKSLLDASSHSYFRVVDYRRHGELYR